MADPHHHAAGGGLPPVPDRIVVPGLTVEVDTQILVMSLRHFAAHPAADEIARHYFGAPLPAALAALALRGGQPPVGRERRRYPRWILAWRSPTETWVLGSDPRDMTELEAQFAASGDACAVDQTGGIGTLRVQGERTDDLLLRLGSTASVPSLGEARTSRIAEIAVMTLRVRSDELLLLFENAHAGHLLGWIEAIAADLQPAG